MSTLNLVIESIISTPSPRPLGLHGRSAFLCTYILPRTLPYVASLLQITTTGQLVPGPFLTHIAETCRLLILSDRAEQLGPGTLGR